MLAPAGGVVKGGQTPSVEVAIDDPHDVRLADYRELPDPAARRRLERTELFVAEGVTAVARLLASGHRVRSVLVTALNLDFGPAIWWPSKLAHEPGGDTAPPAPPAREGALVEG